MDRQVQTMKNSLAQYLGKTSMQVRGLLGNPKEESAADIWFYDVSKRGLYSYEMVLFFEENVVENVVLVKYLLGIKLEGIKINDSNN